MKILYLYYRLIHRNNIKKIYCSKYHTLFKVSVVQVAVSEPRMEIIFPKCFVTKGISCLGTNNVSVFFRLLLKILLKIRKVFLIKEVN